MSREDTPWLFEICDDREEMMSDFDIDLHGLNDVLEAIPDFVLVVDRTGVIQYVNQLEAGFERDDVIGTPADAFPDAPSSERFNAALEETFRTGDPQDFDTVVQLPDGSEAWYRSRMHPLRREGTIVAAVVLSSNVTELKFAQAELENLRRLLPICSWCDRIENEDGRWESIEAYLKRETGTDVSHGLCPDCYERQTAGMPSDGAVNGGAA